MANFRNAIFTFCWRLALVFGVFFISLAGARGEYNVACESVEDCPGFVAGLRHDFGVCTSFLVNKNTMATNLHCIAEDLRKENADCSQRMKVMFPKTSALPAETFDCEKIISVSSPLQEKGISVDYAFFKIKGESSRPSLEISQKGISDQAAMTIFKVDPVGDHGVLKKVQCEAIQKTVLNPYFLSDLSPLVFLSPCNIIKGNSGSPIIASDGSVRGIVSSITSVPKLVNIPTSGDMTVAFGSNFSCINTFFLGINRGTPKDCELKIDEAMKKKLVDETNTKIVESLNGNLNKNINEALETLLSSTKGTVRWKLVTLQPTVKEAKFGISNVFSFEPECLLPKVRDIASLADRLRTEPVSFDIQLNKILVQYDLDNRYRIRGDVRQQGSKVQLSVTPLDFLKKTEIPVLLQTDQTKATVKIPLCQIPRSKNSE